MGNRYKPRFHHRRSTRLKGYDYSQPGAYFVRELHILHRGVKEYSQRRRTAGRQQSKRCTKADMSFRMLEALVYDFRPALAV